MPSDLSEEPILIAGYEGKSTAGIIHVQVLTSAQRWSRSLGRALLLLVLSILSVLIPLLHFVLVPLGLLLTVIIFSVSYAVKSLILEGNGTCPYCQHSVRIYKRVYRLPFQDVCESCNRALVVQAAN